MFLAAETLTVAATGNITATAPPVGRSTSASGGYVLLRGESIDVGTGRVTALGGTGIGGNASTFGQDNWSSDGYIVIQATTVTGSTLPAANELAN